MGATHIDDELAKQLSGEIPSPCKKYLSHHIRNGLVSIMGIASKIPEEPEAMRELESYVKHIALDLEKLGL